MCWRHLFQSLFFSPFLSLSLLLSLHLSLPYSSIPLSSPFTPPTNIHIYLVKECLQYMSQYFTDYNESHHAHFFCHERAIQRLQWDFGICICWKRCKCMHKCEDTCVCVKAGNQLSLFPRSCTSWIFQRQVFLLAWNSSYINQGLVASIL